jgi:hypothetical protein
MLKVQYLRLSMLLLAQVLMQKFVVVRHFARIVLNSGNVFAVVESKIQEL